jgi:hypothetical protein
LRAAEAVLLSRFSRSNELMMRAQRPPSRAIRSLPRRRLSPWRRAAATVILASSTDAATQPSDVEPFHFGYAPMFGSGVYRLSDDTETRVVRLSLSKRLRAPSAARGPGIRLLLPLTLGVQRGDDEESPADRPADRIEHAAFLPGVELELPRSERLTLRVRGQVGWGAELEGPEDTARLYAVGIRSRLMWPNAAGRPALINGLLWAGYDPELTPRRSMLRLTSALEFEVPVPRWQFRDETMHLKPHVLVDGYYRPPESLAFGNDEAEHLTTEWQIGLAAGRETGFKLLWFELDSIGIAYRFSERSEGIRFFIGSVF